LNTLHLSSGIRFPQPLLGRRFQLNIFAPRDRATVNPRSPNRIFRVQKGLKGQFDLPINYLSIFTVVLSGLVTDGSYSTLALADRLTALLPAYTEWPLFFTTLRLVMASVTG
jgi:hypothetical protein